MSEGKEATPAIGVSLSIQIGNGRSMVLQTHVDQHLPEGEINKVLDLVRAVADRQNAYYEAQLIEAELEKQQDTLADLSDAMDRLDKALDGKKKIAAGLQELREDRAGHLPHQDKVRAQQLAAEIDKETAERNNALANRDRLRLAVARGLEKLGEARKKAK